MYVRLAAALASAVVLAGCDVVPVEGVQRSDSALERTCLGSVAASLKLDRDSLSATGVQSLPEGDFVTVATSDGSVRCYTDLSGKVVSIQHVAPPPPVS
jgi:hypothetical protein